MRFRVDPARVQAELDELARFSDDPAPAVKRVLYTPTDLEGRAYVRRLALEAGLEARVDPAGNAFYRLPGRESGGVVGTGSHIDAIPNAGKLDGTVGVIGGVAALRAIRESGAVPRRPIEVIAFTSEEPTRFGIGCLGSRLMAGAIACERVRALRDAEGTPFEDARRAAGFEGALEDVRLPQDYFSAFVELHVEQGPILEAEKLEIGAVTAIAAPASYRVRVLGEGGHAGGVLMPARRDALCGASELVISLERLVREVGGADTVGTVGMLGVHPGAVNSIPSEVRFTIDLRDIDHARRERVWGAFIERMREVSAARKLETSLEPINEDAPCLSDEAILLVIEASCRALGLSHKRMVSRAYHDTLFIARIARTAMIFVPSRAGVSHRPDEHTPPEQIAHGVEVLASTLYALADR
ncbi:MAG: M20 family metallo-hydrolase [Sandaracinaceae bacterium]|nr:M20 family metallo-hydrolase [Sandaracinaceae bacterium]